MEIALEKLPIKERWSLANQILGSIAHDSKKGEALAISAEEKALVNANLSEIFAKNTVNVTSINVNKPHDFMAYVTEWREKNKDILTDDDLWENVRDKNDFGRETSCWDE